VPPGSPASLLTVFLWYNRKKKEAGHYELSTEKPGPGGLLPVAGLSGGMRGGPAETGWENRGIAGEDHGAAERLSVPVDSLQPLVSSGRREPAGAGPLGRMKNGGREGHGKKSETALAGLEMSDGSFVRHSSRPVLLIVGQADI
jgi:hypothetical protein